MIKSLLKFFYVWFTNPLVRKNQEIKHYLIINKKKRLLNSYFTKNETEIIFENKNGIKLNLQKQNRLTEFILLASFEESELKFIASYLKEGDIVFEIGANIGLHALQKAYAVGKTGKVYAFEPALLTYKFFEKNISLNSLSNIYAYNMGMSNIKSVMNLNISTNYDAWNTLADRERLLHNKEVFERLENVTLTTLDEFIDENKIDRQRIALIKIDVEGWEKFVLEGGAKLLSEMSPLLMIEFDENNMWAAGYTGLHLYELSNSFGYSIFKLEDRQLIDEPKQLHYPSQKLFALKNIPNNLYNRIIKQTLLCR